MNLERIPRFFSARVAYACAIAFLLSTLPALAQQPLQVLHNHVRPAVSSGQAKLVGSLPSTQQLNLSILLPLRNEAELDSLLGELYDPSSPNYRQFLSVAEFTDQFGPTAEDFQTIVDFANANGFTVSDTPPNRLVVPISGTAEQIEKAFKVKMNVYQHPTEDRAFFSPDREPSLNLSVPITHIDGLNNFSLPHRGLTKAPAEQAIAAGAYQNSSPIGGYLGSDMRAAYYGGTALTGAGQIVGLFEWGGYNLSDVNESFSNAGQTYNVPIVNDLVNGASASLSACGSSNGSVNDDEQVLDIVAAIGMAPGLNQVRVYIGPCLDNADVFNQMAYENVAKQISNSWSWSPDDPGTDDPIFKEMAAQGQSVFTSSGDWGSYPIIDSSYRYYFPEEDAYVTAVGGTVLPLYEVNAPWPEIAWGDGYCTGYCASGGGWSQNGTGIPSWQSGLDGVNGASTRLRNIPDVAANAGSGIYICPMGDCYEGGGTSLATPLWAGFMALVNQQSVGAGKSTLGFINPAIYAIGESSSYDNDFHDITSGSNGAYSAGTGYDLVTGWGSPNGQNLINALAPSFTLSASPSSLTVAPGSSGTTAITATPANGFNSAITVSMSGVPAGVLYNISFPAGNVTTISFLPSLTAPGGSFPITVTATGGGITNTITVTLNISAGFTCTNSPNPISVLAGFNNYETINCTAFGGFNAPITLTASSPPAGVTVSNVTIPAPGSGTSLMSVMAYTSTPAGSYPITIVARGGGFTQTMTFVLNVENFAISASPASVTVAPGGSGASTITTVAGGGFNSAISLTLTGQPTGVSLSFSATTIGAPGSGSSTMTLTVFSTATPGTYPITVTGTGGGIAHTVTVTLTVPGFVFTPLQNYLAVYAGNATTTPITTTVIGGFNAPVYLTASGMPTGVSVSPGLNPIPAPGSGTSIVTFYAASTVPGGEYPITITGTGGGITQTEVVEFYVSNFSISALPSSVSAEQASSGTTTITMSEPGSPLEQAVSLTSSGAPTGVSVGFSPTSLNPGILTSTMTITTLSTAVPGTYPITVTGTGTATGESIAHSITVLLTVTPGGGFTLSTPPANPDVWAGSSITWQVTSTISSGFNAPITFSASNLPSGVSVVFSPNPIAAPGSGTTTMTITATTSATGGCNAPFTVTGTGGGVTGTAKVGLCVTNFSLSAAPSTVSVAQGSSGTSTITAAISSGPQEASPTLSASGMPAGVTVTFSPTQLNPGTITSTMTIATLSTTVPGTYPLTVIGTTSEGLTQSTPVVLIVHTPGSFSLSSNPAPAALWQGGSTTWPINITGSGGFSGPVSLISGDVPLGVTITYGPNPINVTSGNTVTSTMTIYSTLSAPAGNYTIVVAGLSGGASESLNVPLYVTVLTVSALPTSISVLPGSSGTSTITNTTTSGPLDGMVALTSSGAPNGVTVNFNPTSMAPNGTSTMTVTVPSGTAAGGPYTIMVSGTNPNGGGAIGTAAVALTVP